MIKDFRICGLIGLVWVQISEIWRYFAIVKPETVRYFSAISIDEMSHVDNVIVWGLWGTLLTFSSLVIYRLVRQRIGKGIKTVFMSTVLSWGHFFVLFWIGSANMGLAEWSFVAIPLSLSFIELLVLNLLVDRVWIGTVQSESFPKYDATA